MASLMVIGKGSEAQNAMSRIGNIPGLTSSFISAESADQMRSAIMGIAPQGGDDLLLLVDGRYSPGAGELTNFAHYAAQNGSSVVIPPSSINGQTFEAPDTRADAIIQNITVHSTMIPVFAVRRSFLKNRQSISGQSFTSIALWLAVDALGEGSVDSDYAERVMFTSNGAFARDTLSREEIGALIKHVVASCNLEDMFPNHAWAEHQKESAAACFHSLAATFLKLGESTSAQECLQMGDKFEDSPRSLALKGLIAMNNGETLGAVANMVSSLTQYELRKKADGTHYLHFIPQDMELINSSLKCGLSALNQRDNGSALKYFALAVFNFDPFYKQFGIDKVSDA